MTDEELAAMSNAELEAITKEGRERQEAIGDQADELSKRIDFMKDYNLREAGAFWDVSLIIWSRFTEEKSRRRQALWEGNDEQR